MSLKIQSASVPSTCQHLQALKIEQDTIEEQLGNRSFFGSKFLGRLFSFALKSELQNVEKNMTTLISSLKTDISNDVKVLSLVIRDHSKDKNFISIALSNMRTVCDQLKTVGAHVTTLTAHVETLEHLTKPDAARKMGIAETKDTIIFQLKQAVEYKYTTSYPQVDELEDIPQYNADKSEVSDLQTQEDSEFIASAKSIWMELKTGTSFNDEVVDSSDSAQNNFNDFLTTKIRASEKELIEERDMVLGLIKKERSNG